jgi:hypothetical protein
MNMQTNDKTEYEWFIAGNDYYENGSPVAKTSKQFMDMDKAIKHMNTHGGQIRVFKGDFIGSLLPSGEIV